MEIHKCTPAGAIMTVYPGTVAERDAAQIVIQAEWTRADRDLGYAVFCTGDCFTEYFYADRWFNIMQINAATDGALKGWYCNVSRPARITEDRVAYDDLYLDVWIAPDGAALILDEDEFAAADLDAATRDAARAGLAEVVRWAAAGIGPFAAR